MAKVRRYNDITEGYVLVQSSYKLCIARAAVNENVCEDSTQLTTCSLQGQQFLLS